MKKRDFLKVSDLDPKEAAHVLSLAKVLKSEPRGRRTTALAGRAVAILMEKASTRTRVSFEVGAAQLGAHPVVLSTEASQLGRGEPISDTAKVLSRYADAIVYRTSKTARLLEMATATVPVVNALTDDGHPVQILCDVFTMEESLAARGLPPLAGRRVAFVGDGSSNMARSFVEAAPRFGFHLALAAPPGYAPPRDELDRAGDHVSLHADARAAVAGSDFVHTDVWASMGQESEAAARRQAFSGWTVDGKLLALANEDARVMHCLPAHRGEEIDAETLAGERSIVWDQAENRLHVQKALLLWLLDAA